jgi:solute carrier family 25 protein 16
VFSGLVKIVKFENLWALYKGNGAQMVRIFPYAATQFTSYEVYKPIFGNMMSQHHFSKFLSGSAAGITAVLLTYPLDTIRARLAFQITGEHKYSGITHTAITMFKEVIENVSYPRIGSFLVLLVNRKEEVRLYIEALHPLL